MGVVTLLPGQQARLNAAGCIAKSPMPATSRYGMLVVSKYVT
jgi:hypothetical protein